MKDWRQYTSADSTSWARDYAWFAGGVYSLTLVMTQYSDKITAVIWPSAYPNNRVNDFVPGGYYVRCEDFADLDSAVEWCNNKVAELRVETTLKYS